MEVIKFTFNPFAENTYLLVDETNLTAIVDPGMSNKGEEQEVVDYLNENDLELVMLLNTHCHIDHILGNQFIHEKYGLELISSKEEQVTLGWAEQSSLLWNIPYKGSPEITTFVHEGNVIEIGESQFEVLFVPGHSVGHVVFVNRASKVVIAGDTLFRESIGRTDLPGGNHEELLKNIKEKLYALPDDFVVYNGHGPETTIGHEKKYNPFVRA